MVVVSSFRPPFSPRRVHRTAKEIAASFRALGFVEGAPLHAQGAAIDARITRHRKCVCGKRGMKFTAYSCGTRYRGLASCAVCGHGEEV